MLQRLILIVIMLFLIGAVSESANKQGMQPEGTLIPGNSVIVGTTVNDLKDGGPPASKSIAIGDPVLNSTPGKCLTVDAQGKVAQTDCLLAH